jgi:hypothetical protein
VCVPPVVSSAQSIRDVLPAILLKVLESSPCVMILLRIGVSLSVSSSSSNESALERPCSIHSII